jgi:hypothetical protein
LLQYEVVASRIYYDLDNSPQELARPSRPFTIQKYQNNHNHWDGLEILVIMHAKPRTTNKVLLRTSARRAQGICVQLELLNQTIREYDEEIRTRMHVHATRIVKSLPCGTNV